MNLEDPSNPALAEWESIEPDAVQTEQIIYRLQIPYTKFKAVDPR